MKKFIALILTIAIFLTGCSFENVANISSEISSITDSSDMAIDDSKIGKQNNITSLDDPNLPELIEENVYNELIDSLNDSNYFVENVQAIYISQEYIDELEYNSQANIYFGYTLDELNQVFEGNKFVFTTDDNGQTTVKAFEEYDDTYDKIIRNVAIGTGVILICVTVSVLTAGSASTVAVSAIFAAAAKGAAIGAVSNGALGGVAAGAVTAVQTGDTDAAMKAAALEASEGFKWGAIIGAVSGGSGKALELKGATLNGLTMNEAAQIQKESKWPIDLIKSIHSKEEYNILNSGNHTVVKIGGRNVLVPKDINWNLKDAKGLTNLERAEKGYSILDSSGNPYEVHHIGQKNDGPFALLTKSEHMSDGHNKILHYQEGASEIDRTTFAKVKKDLFKNLFKLKEEGVI